MRDPGESASAVRAAGVAGLVFAVLTTAALLLMRDIPPATEAEFAAWWETYAPRFYIALYLIPFAGIAFLWLLAALRHRIGRREDQFFATVLLGSGLLFVAMLFASGAAAAALLSRPSGRTGRPMTSSCSAARSRVPSSSASRSRWRPRSCSSHRPSAAGPGSSTVVHDRRGRDRHRPARDRHELRAGRDRVPAVGRDPQPAAAPRPVRSGCGTIIVIVGTRSGARRPRAATSPGSGDCPEASTA